MDSAKMLKRVSFIAWSNRVLKVNGWDDPFWLFSLFPAPRTLTKAHCGLIYKM